MEPITIIILWFTSMLTIAVCTGVIAKQIENLSQIKSNPQPRSNLQPESIEAKSAWDALPITEILAVADHSHEQAQLEAALTVQENLTRRYAQPKAKPQAIEPLRIRIPIGGEEVD
jgi:hypothetical protein